MQMSFFAPTRTHDGVALRSSYVPNRVERPADLPRLRESAETMERRVLELFRRSRMRDVSGETLSLAMTPSMCADAMGLNLTTVRPRICVLAKRTEGPRLERCTWLPRRPTEDGGSEGWYRFKEDV